MCRAWSIPVSRSRARKRSNGPWLHIYQGTCHLMLLECLLMSSEHPTDAWIVFSARHTRYSSPMSLLRVVRVFVSVRFICSVGRCWPTVVEASRVGKGCNVSHVGLGAARSQRIHGQIDIAILVRIIVIRFAIFVMCPRGWDTRWSLAKAT